MGIYPDDLRVRLRDRVAIMGGQWLMPLGYAIQGTMASPEDGMEIERRLCRWVADICWPIPAVARVKAISAMSPDHAASVDST